MAPVEIASKFGKYAAIPFTVFVVGLLIYLHFFATVQVPVLGEWGGKPVVKVCSTAPKWVMRELPQGLNFWEKVGKGVRGVETGDCSQICSVEKDGVHRMVACEPGKILIDLRDQAFSEKHADETIHPDSSVFVWVTILVPEAILGESGMGDSSVLEPTAFNTLPRYSPYSLTMAHMLGHAFGYGHAFTPIIPGLLRADPTGHVMNPELNDGGWSTEGIGE